MSSPRSPEAVVVSVTAYVQGRTFIAGDWLLVRGDRRTQLALNNVIDHATVGLPGEDFRGFPMHLTSEIDTSRVAVNIPGETFSPEQLPRYLAELMNHPERLPMPRSVRNLHPKVAIADLATIMATLASVIGGVHKERRRWMELLRTQWFIHVRIVSPTEWEVRDSDPSQ